MRSTKPHHEFYYYMHDGTAAFSFELAGELSDDSARELEQVWLTASSSTGNKLLIVDLSFVTCIGTTGEKLLRHWYEEGAQLVATLPQARAIVESITGRRPEPIVNHHTWLPFRTSFRARF
ncbi:MAG: anti-sigma factor antagonist [Bryobacterales bacterium]|nr:anti-sigma factor antagonist [Bryobacterales bacterium]